MPLSIPDTNSIPECLQAISALVAKHNITGIGIVLIRDGMHYSTHQCNMSIEDMLIAGDLFLDYSIMEDA